MERNQTHNDQQILQQNNNNNKFQSRLNQNKIPIHRQNVIKNLELKR